MTSVYEWNGAVEDSAEMLLMIKTAVDRYDAVEAWIGAHHSYAIPEVLMLPAGRGSARYLEWLARNIAPGDGGPSAPPAG